MNIYDIARVAHEVNRAYCEAYGDMSQVSWEEAPEWQRKSAVDGVRFHRENPDSKPSDSHENWLEEKKKEGWKYGRIKDAEKKEHPCFLPYKELPVEQIAKEYIFSAVVKTMLKIMF